MGTSSTSGRGIISGLSEQITCARLAAQARLDTDFPPEGALVGYGERSLLFFTDEAVLKIFTHRPAERMQRDAAGLRAAATRPGLRAPEVLACDDAPGALAWLAMTRLEGVQACELDSPGSTEQIAHVAALLHTTPDSKLGDLPEFGLRLREDPVDDAEAEGARRLLAEALAPVEDTEHARCTRSLVHGDFSARNILLPAHGPPGVIDFEGCGVGCPGEDLAKLHLNEVVIAGRDTGLITRAYTAKTHQAHPGAPVPDAFHVGYHLARHLRWVLQWAPAIDPDLTHSVMQTAPGVAAALGEGR